MKTPRDSVKENNRIRTQSVKRGVTTLLSLAFTIENYYHQMKTAAAVIPPVEIESRVTRVVLLSREGDYRERLRGGGKTWHFLRSDFVSKTHRRVDVFICIQALNVLQTCRICSAAGAE